MVSWWVIIPVFLGTGLAGLAGLAVVGQQASHGSCIAPSWTDPNLLDWFTFYGCTAGVGSDQVASNAGLLAASIESDVVAIIFQVINGVIFQLEQGVTAVENAVAQAIIAVINTFEAIVLSLYFVVTQLATPFGPLAPIVIVLATFALIIGGIVGLYFATIVLWAIFKSAFNLL